jgi:hypothetical protein
VNERCLLGVVPARDGQCQRLGLGDLVIKIVQPNADKLKRVEYEALIEAGFQELEPGAQRMRCVG